MESRYGQLYPPHKCEKCGVEHTFIPKLALPQRGPEGEIQVPLTPFEVIGLADSTGQPSQVPDALNTPVRLYVLLWGAPGTHEPQHASFLHMN